MYYLLIFGLIAYLIIRYVFKGVPSSEETNYDDYWQDTDEVKEHYKEDETDDYKVDKSSYQSLRESISLEGPSLEKESLEGETLEGESLEGRSLEETVYEGKSIKRMDYGKKIKKYKVEEVEEKDIEAGLGFSTDELKHAIIMKEILNTPRIMHFYPGLKKRVTGL